MLASSSLQGTSVPCQTRQQQGRNVRRARAAVRVQAEQQQGEPRVRSVERMQARRGSLDCAHLLARAPADAAEPLMVRAARGEAIERAPCW